uniref:Uncharacterized protein n=1 Tax=Candidatus Kentrum sp. LFY TaxID=2126342 RepID=A0A450U4X5_9GAMM|nr:MAG: hypothetical protein BECKLFY1418B_GA0070995_100156 [Candidatus Kentron sp. LFY]
MLCCRSEAKLHSSITREILNKTIKGFRFCHFSLRKESCALEVSRESEGFFPRRNDSLFFVRKISVLAMPDWVLMEK